MKIAIIGAGNIGSALAFGLAQSGCLQPEDICISNTHAQKLENIKQREPRMRTTTDNRVCTDGADVVFIAVKPWKLAPLAEVLRGILNYRTQTVCSMVGGAGLDHLEEVFHRSKDEMRKDEPEVPALYYLIPNTAIAVRQSMTFLSSRGSTQEMDEQLVELFKHLGDAMLVEERLMNAGLVLASCGIAYALRYIRSATGGGVQLGFRTSEAQHIVVQTLRGAAELLETHGSHPEEEIDKVTTPGGLTIRGLNAMEKIGFTAAIIEGITASFPK